jgi:hypothetical protein
MYPKAGKMLAYPDPTGKRAITSAAVGASDFSILEKAGIGVLAKNGSPPVVDSVAAVNSMFCNANGERRLFIHPRCENLIRDLERAAWLDSPNKAVMDKRGDNDPHFADALRYPMDYLFPVINRAPRVKAGFMF